MALAITSLLRQRIGFGGWRAVHWLAYASWPIALVHGLGTGSDVKSSWLLVLSSRAWRSCWAPSREGEAGWPANCACAARPRRRGVFSLFLALWLPGGPLAPAGRAARARRLAAAPDHAATPIER